MDSGDRQHLVFSNQRVAFAVLIIIYLVFLLKNVVAHLGEKLVVKLGVSTLCAMNSYPPKPCDAVEYY